jgi:mevalonate pyrophosphate decarboxylase
MEVLVRIAGWILFEKPMTTANDNYHTNRNQDEVLLYGTQDEYYAITKMRTLMDTCREELVIGCWILFE